MTPTLPSSVSDDRPAPPSRQPSGTPPLHVVTGADEGYRRPLAVTVASLLLNLSPERRLHLYLLDSGLSPRTRRRLGALVDRLRPDTRLRWLTLDPAEFAHLKVDHRKYLSAAAYARLKIPELLPGLDRVIYLDSDLVVHADLTPLWSADLQGRLVGAVQDSGIPVVGARYGIESFEALGLNAGSPYFNSGVLVIDLAAWRAHDIPKQVFTYLTTYADRLNTCDQEGLNAVLCGRWAPLDFRWNVTTEFFEVENRIPRGPLYDSFHRAVDAAHTGVSASPRIVHYTSPRKPWHGTSRHPFRGEFFRYLRRSGWMRPTAYTAWRTRVAARTLLHGLRNRTRGLRHKVGLTRSLLPARDPEPVS